MSSSSETDDESPAEEVKPQRPAKRTKTNDNPLGDAPLQTLSGTAKTRKPSDSKPIIVLLDQASLETVKNRRNVYELLNCDDHRDLCRKRLKKDPNSFRPDILHQELLALLDSPLNKAGFLKVYIRTQTKVLIDVHPSLRMPRTYKRFSGLMVQLLHKMKIKASTEESKSITLLKVIKNPFSQHLPAGTRCLGLECGGDLYSPVKLAEKFVPDDCEHPIPTCFVVGAMSSGNITLEDHPYLEQMISVSSYPLSGAAALSRIVSGIEHKWGIV